MKLYRNAIILVVIVAILGGAYYFLNKNKGNTGNSDSAANATTASITLTNFTADNIESLTLKNDDGTLVIGKKDKDWVVTSPADFNGDTNMLSSMVNTAVSLSAEKMITDKAGDLSQFGLANPVAVTIKPKTGSEVTVEIGGQTPTKDDYYVMLGGNSKVYTVASYTIESLLKKKIDLKNKTLFTFKDTDLTDLAMYRKGESVFSSHKASDSSWNMLTPIQGNVNSYAVSPMLQAIAGTTVLSYVDENPADLAKYGLAKPSYELDFGTSSEKYKLLLGDEKSRGSEIYAMLEGRNEVFTISESAYTFLDKPLKEIVDTFAFITNMENVNKIELTMDGQTTTMGVDVYKDKDGNTDNTKDKFTVNGKDASGKGADGKQPFRAFYEALIGISLDDLDINAVPAGNPEISIKYYLKTDPGTMQVDFISKDPNYYYVMRNGKYAGIVVKKDKVDMGIGAMKEKFKALTDFVNNGQK